MEDAQLDLTGTMTPRELAAALGVHVETVARWRREHTGPPFVKVGGRYRYEGVAVRQWIEQGGSTSGKG